MADPRIKQIKIKAGVVKRLAKEKVYYEKEADKEQERHDKMKAEGADDHQLRKQTEVINESKAMVPDTKGRLVKARDELTSMLETEKDLAESAEYKEAQTHLADANSVLSA